jgi:hypothetical protein
VDSRTDPLLEGAHGALNLTNVAVRGNNVEVDGTDVVTKAGKLVVSMEITEDETAVSVEAEDWFKCTQHL